MLTTERNPQLNTLDKQIKDAYGNKPIEIVSLPFRRDYEIVFHEQELFKFNLNAQPEMLGIVLIS